MQLKIGDRLQIVEPSSEHYAKTFKIVDIEWNISPISPTAHLKFKCRWDLDEGVIWDHDEKHMIEELQSGFCRKV